MDSRQIKLVQDTFRQIEPVAQDTGELLYYRLFEMDPSVRPLFKGDMKQQATMVMTALGLAVRGLDKPDTVDASVQALGHRHDGYGVQPRDYTTFSAALLWAIEQSLGEAFAQEAKEAWIAAFATLAAKMRSATVAGH